MPLDLPDEIQRVVVFDTNAYRQMAWGGDVGAGRERARSLVERERSAGTQALGFPPVLLELMAHLADPAGESYDVARAAVVIAAEHCAMPRDDATIGLAIQPSPDSQLCQSLFHATPERVSRNDDLVRAMARRVADDPSDAGLEKIRADLQTVSRLTDEAESVFARSMRQHLMDDMTTNVRARGHGYTRKELLDSFREYLVTEVSAQVVAEAHVSRAADILDRVLEPSELHDMARWLTEKFPVPIEMYRQVVRKIAESNWDLTEGKGANLLWDLQVAFLIGEEHTVSGRPTVVVTGDKEILKAAKACGAESRVLSLNDYREQLH